MRRAVIAVLLFEVDDTGTYRRGHRDSSPLPGETSPDWIRRSAWCPVLPPGELLHYRCQRVQVVDEERADAKALAQVGELARQVLDAADEHMRRVQYLLDCQLDP